MDSQILLGIVNGLSSLVKDADYISLAMLGGTAFIIYECATLSTYLKRVATRKTKKFAKDFPSLIDMNSHVLTKLRHAKSELNADRVAVVQFHNGCQNLSGIDFAKMSCTHEAVRPGLKPAQADFLNLPVSAFSYLTNAAFGIEPKVIMNIERLRKFDMSTYTLLKSHKAVSFALAPLVSDDQDVFGFIIVEFCKIREDITSGDFQFLLKTYAEKIATLLDRSDLGDLDEERLYKAPSEEA